MRKLLKKVLTIFICLNLFFVSPLVFAGAAEKWEYEVVPDQNQKLNVTGHKVDQYGDAVNDKQYKTTIDPKTTANKQKMGGVAISKLLKKANWAIIGVSAFQYFLEGLDWVIDLESQSIWRYKDNGSSFSCRDFDHKWNYGTKSYNCPADAAAENWICNNNIYAKNCKLVEIWADEHYTIKASTLPNSPPPPRLYLEIAFDYNQQHTSNYLTLYKGDEKIQDRQKEELTPEQAADYANKTHQDFNDPRYRDKANQNYKPEIQEDLWKPHNDWEEENSPTVQTVKQELEKANPESKDTDIKPKEDEEGNPVGFSLPSFCSWATTVCDFIKDIKKDPEIKEENQEVEIEDKVPTKSASDFDVMYMNFGGQCPTFEAHSISVGSISVPIAFDLTPICNFAIAVRPAIISLAYLAGMGIVANAIRET